MYLYIYSAIFTIRAVQHSASMRLLQLQDDVELSLIERLGNNIPRYAILSHI
jgi:hypothetical protein